MSTQYAHGLSPVPLFLLIHLLLLYSSSALPTGGTWNNLSLKPDNSTLATGPEISVDLIDHDLRKRECKWDKDRGKYVCDSKMPTLSQIMVHMQEGNGQPEKYAVFYTNLRNGNSDYGGAWLSGWLKSRKMEDKYYWWANVFGNSKWLQNQVGYMKANVDLFKTQNGITEDPVMYLTYCSYEALSLNAENPDAYIFTRGDQEWKADSAWRIVELPALLGNVKIQRIWRVDPRPAWMKGIKTGDKGYCDHDKPVLWYDRNDAKYKDFPKQYDQKWSCKFRT